MAVDIGVTYKPWLEEWDARRFLGCGKINEENQSERVVTPGPRHATETFAFAATSAAPPIHSRWALRGRRGRYQHLRQ
jgi:hypothetical protein